MVKTFKVESFKSIESAQLELGRINVFIGANGSGKSNLLEAFGVLAAAAFGRVDSESLLRRGCRPGGYYRPLFPETRRDAETVATATGLEASYCIELVSPAPDRATGWEYRREVLTQGDQVIVDRETSNGIAKGDPQVGLAALKLAEMSVESEAAMFLKKLAGFSIYAPDTPILRGWSRDPQAREPVGLSGGRLADAVFELQKQDNASEMIEQFRGAVEWFAGFGIVEFPGVEFPSPVSASQSPRRAIAFMDRFFRIDNNHHYFLGPNEVNEGALYLLFVTVLCLHKAGPKLFALDNVDHSLNPLLARNLMRTICRWLLEGKEERQVLMTTQNPLVLDGLSLQDDRVRLFTVDRDNKGRTIVKQFVLTEEHLKKAQEGWPLSRMWVNGLIGGIPNV
jgi:predicted ATPase